MLISVCWEGWQHSATTPHANVSIFCMQKIDVTPSVAMLNACFAQTGPFAISFKGGIRIEAEPLDDGWRLRRIKHGVETSWVALYVQADGDVWDIWAEGSEPIATGMARGIAPYHTRDEQETEYYTAVMSVYGGKVSHILSVER